MKRMKGYQRARLMRGKQIGGKKFTPDGLDRSDPSGLAMLGDAYLVSLEVKNQSPRTVESRRHSLKLFLTWAQERSVLRPLQVTRVVLQSYQRHLWRHRKNNGQPLSPGTQLGRLSAVRGLFKWLYREDWIESDPAAHLELPKELHQLPHDTLSRSEVAIVLNVPDVSDPLGIRDRAMLEILYATGLRRTELARAEIRDLNTDRQTLHVRHGKGGRHRMVPVGETALMWLDRYLERTRPLLLDEPGEQALFLTGYGRGFSPASLGNRIAGIMRKALDRPGSCHLLRHACATHMLEGGADIRVIQQLLGHSKLETTQVYTEVSITHLREVYAKTHPSA